MRCSLAASAVETLLSVVTVAVGTTATEVLLQGLDKVKGERRRSGGEGEEKRERK